MQTQYKIIGDYKIKEIFNDEGKSVKEVINEIFSIYFVDAYNKEINSENGQTSYNEIIYNEFVLNGGNLLLKRRQYVNNK